MHRMTVIERDILAVLDELDSAIKPIPAGEPKPNLLALFNKLDRLTEALPSGTDPELLHFLRRKSYEKARSLLRTRERQNEPPVCG